MARIYQVILTENAVQARFMGMTALADGHPDQAAMQHALQRGAAVVEIHLAAEG